MLAWSRQKGTNRALFVIATCAMLLCASCVDEAVPGADGWTTSIPTERAFERLAAGIGEVKFTLPVEGAGSVEGFDDDCYFVNSSRYEWHADFIGALLGRDDLSFDTYRSWILYPESRTLWSGSIRHWADVNHPGDQQPGVYGFSLYSESVVGVGVGLHEVVELARRLRECAPALAGKLAFAPSTAAAANWAEFYRDVLVGMGLWVVLPSEVTPDSVIEVLSEGEAYGTLRVFPAEEPAVGVGERDIVVVSIAPSELTVVAGLMTAHTQNVFSHANLRFREAGIPNVVVPDIYDWPEVEALAGTMVHLVATGAEVTLSPATLEEAEAFWESRTPDPQTLPEVDLSVRELAGFAEIGADDVDTIGGKAAGLGELHALLPSRHRPEGFAIPFVYYAEHVERSGSVLAINSLLADEAAWFDVERKSSYLERIRDAIREAPVSDELLFAVRDRILETYGEAAERLRIRFRSSANSEDLEGRSGAGLHDSRSGCIGDSPGLAPGGPPAPSAGSACMDDATREYFELLLAERRAQARAHDGDTPEWLSEIIDELEEDLHERRPIENAIRGVWASLWTERAFDDRVWRGIDHRDAYMAIAVHPAFVREEVNAVAVTGSSAVGAEPYALLSQVGYESVVEPMDPTATAERIEFVRAAGSRLPANVLVHSHSSLSEGGARLWSDAQLEVLADLLFTVHDHFEALVRQHDPSATPRFDVEIERTVDGEIVIKQVRRYLGGG